LRRGRGELTGAPRRGSSRCSRRLVEPLLSLGNVLSADAITADEFVHPVTSAAGLVPKTDADIQLMPVV